MNENLSSILRYLAPFTQAELVEINTYLKPRSIKKNTIVLAEGQVCKEFYFVLKGGIRTFLVDKNGHEKTRYIMLDHHLGTAFASFINQAPSVEFIDALEDTEMFVISHAHFYQLNATINHWKDFYQKILEMAYTFQTNSFSNLTTLTAKERYDKVCKENPLFIQRLSNKILASYLDVAQETLSRLKGK